MEGFLGYVDGVEGCCDDCFACLLLFYHAILVGLTPTVPLLLCPPEIIFFNLLHEEVEFVNALNQKIMSFYLLTNESPTKKKGRKFIFLTPTNANR